MVCRKMCIIRELTSNFFYIFAVMTYFFTYSTICSAKENNLSYDKERPNKWLIRGMLINIRPLNVKSNISKIGGEIDTPEKNTFGLNASYFFSKELSLELEGGVTSRDYYIKNSKIGSFKVGTIENNSVSLISQYHFNTDSDLSPYLGLGINHAWTRKVKPAEGIPDFKVGSVNSLILNAGIDLEISESWLLSTVLEYIISPEYKFSGYGFNASVQMNTLITGVGISYRF